MEHNSCLNSLGGSTSDAIGPEVTLEDSSRITPTAPTSLAESNYNDSTSPPSMFCQQPTLLTSGKKQEKSNSETKEDINT